MDINVRAARETDRDGIALCIAEGFEKEFSVLCKDIGKVVKAIRGGIKIEKFYIAETAGMLAGVAAVSDCQGRAVLTDKTALKKNFGWIKGLLASLVLKGEFESKLEYPQTTGYIEFVAVRKAYRRRGIASALLRQCTAGSRYQEYVLDVTDINHFAAACYRKLGFQEFKRVKEKYGKQKGFDARIYMKYTV